MGWGVSLGRFEGRNRHLAEHQRGDAIRAENQVVRVRVQLFEIRRRVLALVADSLLIALQGILRDFQQLAFLDGGLVGHNAAYR